MAERLTPIDIGEVDFNDGDLSYLQGVMDGDRGMSVGSGVEYQAACGVARLLDPRNQLALDIALTERKLEPQRLRLPATALLEACQRLLAVNIRLAQTQHVQIGPVYDVNRFHESAYRQSA